MSTEETMAEAFSTILKSWLTPEQTNEVISRNSSPEYKSLYNESSCCASHDFCDANVAMSEAFTSITGREMELQNSGDVSLWNNAWSIAKSNDFFFSKKGHF